MLPSPSAPPFVKVCGFTDPANLRAVCEADDRPDAIGLNLWPGSKRFVGGKSFAESNDALQELIAAAAGLPSWGVYVNASSRLIFDTVVHSRLQGVQLHGDEPPEAIGPLQKTTHYRPLIRAWRPDGELNSLIEYLRAAVPWGGRPDAVLLDAAVPGAYGGTGTKLDWHALRDELDRVGDRLPPVILAGGLTPENVAEAVRVVRPWGVDVAGGVESSPGVKDPARVAAFVAAAKGAGG